MAPNTSTTRRSKKGASTSSGGARKAGQKRRKPAGETPRQAFERLSNLRVNKALRVLSTISYLAHVPTYEWTKSDADLLLSKLRLAVDTIAERFEVMAKLAQALADAKVTKPKGDDAFHL